MCILIISSQLDCKFLENRDLHASENFRISHYPLGLLCLQGTTNPNVNYFRQKVNELASVTKGPGGGLASG